MLTMGSPRSPEPSIRHPTFMICLARCLSTTLHAEYVCSVTVWKVGDITAQLGARRPGEIQTQLWLSSYSDHLPGRLRSLMCQLLALLPAAPCCLHGPGRSSVKSLTYGSHCHRLLVHGAAARNISAQRFGLSRLTAAPGMANLLPVGSTASSISGEAASVASSPSLGSKGFFCRHTPNGSLCKFCKRPDTTENPLLFKRGDQPFLPWRREFGQECNICSYAIRDSSEFKAMTTRALIELVGTPEGHERYMNACVIPYGEKKNASNGKRVQSSPGAKTSTQVTASAYAGLKYEKQLGVLWPVAIYKLPEYEGKIPPGVPSKPMSSTARRSGGCCVSPSWGVR